MSLLNVKTAANVRVGGKQATLASVGSVPATSSRRQVVPQAKASSMLMDAPMMVSAIGLMLKLPSVLTRGAYLVGRNGACGRPRRCQDQRDCCSCCQHSRLVNAAGICCSGSGADGMAAT